MEIAHVLAQIYGAALVVTGLSMMQKKVIADMIDGIERNTGLLWMIGLVAFVLGLVSVELYNEWAPGWSIFVTILGWAMMLKGVVILLFPRGVGAWYRRMIPMNASVGVGTIALILGGGMLYLGFGLSF